jgi:2-oxo-4-hydroxy-4-carboxy-5-ureidoimidazoline decarboxylase
LSSAQAKELLYGCFPDGKWAARMEAGRPYGDVDAVLQAAEDGWAALGPGDWRDAFAGHPRIGEGGGHAPAASETEQGEVRKASDATLSALAAENRRYEARFGHIFLIAARGRSADDILHALRQRMSNDPGKEMEVAAGELRKITRQRLLALLAT